MAAYLAQNIELLKNIAFELSPHLIFNTSKFTFAKNMVLFHASVFPGLPCFPIYKPLNGNKNCSGYRTEDSCHFDCLPGYELTGSKTRSCGPNKQWTGNNTECKSESHHISLVMFITVGNVSTYPHITKSVKTV